MFDLFDSYPSLPQFVTNILRFLITIFNAGDPDETEVEPNP